MRGTSSPSGRNVLVVLVAVAVAAASPAFADHREGGLDPAVSDGDVTFVEEDGAWVLRTSDMSLRLRQTADGHAEPVVEVATADADAGDGFTLTLRRVCEVARGATTCGDGGQELGLLGVEGWHLSTHAENGTLFVNTFLPGANGFLALFLDATATGEVRLGLQVGNWNWSNASDTRTLGLELVAGGDHDVDGGTITGDGGYLRLADTANVSYDAGAGIANVSIVGGGGTIFVVLDGAGGYFTLDVQGALGANDRGGGLLDAIPLWLILLIIGALLVAGFAYYVGREDDSEPEEGERRAPPGGGGGTGDG